MPLYVIEREVPDVGKMTDEQTRQTVLDSLEALEELGEEIQWVQSYVVEDKVYCIYFAASEALIREHAKKTNLPANRISEVRRLLDPRSAASATGTTRISGAQPINLDAARPLLPLPGTVARR